MPLGLFMLFTEKSNSIVITWTTTDDSQESRVQFGVFPTSLDKEAVGNHISYFHIRGQWIHRVTLENLQFNTIYGRLYSYYLLVSNFTTVVLLK